MKYLLICNPHSGTKKNSSALIKKVCHRIESEGHQVELVETQSEGHGYELAKAALDTDVDVIVAVGGDGTVNEVAKALVGSNKILGILPNGSGNGLARELCISLDPTKAVESLLDHKVMKMDTCTANDDPFFVTCGIGFDGKVSENFATSETRGLPAYVKEVLNVFMKYEASDFKLLIDGREVTARALLIAVANASQYGFNAFIAPDASMVDGLLDVTIIRELPQTDAPKVVVQLFSKDITHNEYVRTYRGKEIILSSNRLLPYHIDGEPKKPTERLKITVVPGSLNVIQGKESDREKNLFDFFNSITNGFQDIAQGIRKIFS